MGRGYNKKADTLRVGFQIFWKVTQTFLAGAVAALFPGLITASGTLVLGGLAAVAGGECAPAASSGFVASTGLVASGGT